jgi:hypothetical protein
MSDLGETTTSTAERRKIATARRELAAQSRVLAGDIVNELARISLLAHADELDAQAAALEAEADLQASDDHA